MAETATKKRHLTAEDLASSGAAWVSEDTVTSNAVATVQGTAVTALNDAYATDAGAGMEGAGVEDFSIPFWRILHYQCPEIDKRSGVPGAEPGMIYTPSTQQLINGDDGFVFIPVKRDHTYVEWIPKNTTGGGGGFVGVRSIDDPVLPRLREAHGKFCRLPLESGNELVETFSLFGILVPVVSGGSDAYDPLDAQHGVLSFTSTQIKKYKVVMNRLDNLIGKPRRYPTFAFRWVFGSQPEQNKGGQRFFGWKTRLYGGTGSTALLAPNDPLFLMAKSFYASLKSGEAKADYGTAESSTAGDEDIPF